ncbi:sugar phosphate isomerase/epimerase [Aminobacter sp. NyZ550]|jgi:sugar phosphate isomerase/epimerase|uniref:sugar phosphate isomerase/epimerase family protein n=1 Tax=Aminobacter TaxID=31988 RepID=UPI00177F5969|nr:MULTISPECIES: sugar phosphate isomerase/epimerase [unclassified Aminobacter]QOF71811.1 sugar phosphate isomerase/epimerase [Aminobacter sp. SR38]WAX93577.1 sugar phosphate isomerase/epimerase [Aminobacter sp. NyZ550]WMC99609.1 sugar phosphate isomerase/epimerase [Aminobacter aminovorans]BBD37880.1 xylose isomerase [Aminobacter sp. SS-2016]
MKTREYVCSSHTISGVMPGNPVASRHGFAERVEACAAAGYTGMCLHFRDYAEQRARGFGDGELRAILDAHGMKHVSVEFLTDWFMDGEAGLISRRNEETAFRAAAAFGAKVINVGPDLGERGISLETMQRKFRDLCGRAVEHGLSIALELVAWGNVRDVDTALAIIGDIPNAGLVIDSWHVFRAGVPLADLRRIAANRILCVQVNDAGKVPVGQRSAETMNRSLCGQGAFDLSAFAATLDDMGVAAPFSVEVISPELAALGRNEAAKISFDTARDCFS